MSIAAIKWVTKQKTGDIVTKSLLFWLAWHLNDETRLCCPSLTTLKAEMEVGSINTVRKAIKTLTQAGVISATPERSNGGKIERTCYRITAFEVSSGDMSQDEVSHGDISHRDGALYHQVIDVVSPGDSDSKKIDKKESQDVAQVSASAPALSPAAHSQKKLGGKGRSMSLAEFVDTLPDEWRQYAEKTRPEIDPEKMFTDFRFHFTVGNGADKQRSREGWGSSWQRWVQRENATEANRAKPKAKTPEEKRAYDMAVALAFGFPSDYAAAGMEGRYSGLESDGSALDAVAATRKEVPT